MADTDKAIATQIEQENPRTNSGLRTAILSFREHLVGNVRPALILFAGAVLAVDEVILEFEAI